MQNASEPTQQHSANFIETIANNLIEAPHHYEGQEEDIPWRLVALECASRLRTAGSSPAPPPPNQDIYDLKESIKELQSAVKAIKPSHQLNARVATPSWANIAALRPTNPNIQRAGEPTPMRKGREILVRIDDQKEVQSMQTKSPAQILQEIERRTPTQRAQIASIRRLPSGDVALHAVSIEARRQLEKKPLWANGIAQSSRVLRRRFAVLAHGIRTTLNTQDQSAAIASLQEENKGLHEGLEILRVAWPKKVTESNKSHSSLIIEVASEEMANRLIDYGIIESYGEHDCEYFEKGCRVLQCFNCFKFGHVARSCKNKPFCHKCGGDHTPDTCITQPERMCCASCKEGNHKPWMMVCPRWKKEKEAASERFKNRPYRYPESRGSWSPPSLFSNQPSFGSTPSSFLAGTSSGASLSSISKRSLDASSSSVSKRGRGRKWVPFNPHAPQTALNFAPVSSTAPQQQPAAAQPDVQVPASQP